MGLPYDIFTEAFLSKISDYDFLRLPDNESLSIIDGYMKRAISAFKKVCLYDLITTADDTVREFSITIKNDDIDEVVEIISEGMVVQWLKPYVNKQELLENVLNTRDFTTYSPSELLLRVGNAYKQAKKDYTQMIREYSYNHGELTELHL
jgi:hypothetical protein